MLALDVGNTNCVLGYFEQNVLKHSWRLSTHPACTTDEFTIKLELVLRSAGIHLDQIDAITLSSVVPSFTRIVQAALPARKLRIIDHTWPYSFEIQANPPEQVGADRLVNAEAAVREYGAPCIIVDSGTATTICAVSKNASGRPTYLGGAIIPGIELSMDMLAKKTAHLFTIELVPPKQAIGTNTREALKSGLLLGYASLIDGMVNRFKHELNESQLPVIGTGGISHLMRGITKELTHFEPDLTLRGIAYLHEAVRQR